MGFYIVFSGQGKLRRVPGAVLGVARSPGESLHGGFGIPEGIVGTPQGCFGVARRSALGVWKCFWQLLKPLNNLWFCAVFSDREGQGKP